MKNKFLLIFLYSLIAFIFVGCGKFLERFSRLESNTEIVLDFKKDGINSFATLNGGLMIYFIGANDSGRAFGFTSEDLAQNASLFLPNGLYKIIGLGFTGANPMGGSVKCAIANSGALVNLSGGTQTINLVLDAATCGFAAATIFSSLEGSSGNGSNFDELRLWYCTSVVSGGTCSPDATNTTNAIRYSLLAGEKFPGGMNVDESKTLTSTCLIPAAGQVASSLPIPIGTNEFSAPFRVTIYNDNSCTTPVATHLFTKGLYPLLSPANGDTSFTNIPASQAYSHLRITYP